MKMLRIMAAAAVTAGVAAGTIAPAEAASDLIRWGKVSGWDIFASATLGNGCLIHTTYNGGTELILGYSSDDDEAYLMVGNRNWGSIEEGKSYNVEFRMDRDSPWRATAIGLDIDGFPFLAASTDDGDFLIDFAKKYTLAVTYRGSNVATLNLTGTYAALTEMLRCQDQVDRLGIRGGGGRDPFAR